MNLYEHIKDKIITALVGRPEGTEIQPEAHQEYALELLNYIKFVEIGSTSSLMGFADQFTIPLQPIGAKITYIGAVGANESKTFSNFIDKDGNPITVVAGNNSLIVTLLWNTQYWEYISVPTSVSVVINNNTGEVTGDLETYLKSTFLRKDIADTALGSITFNKNITVKEISSLYALHVNDIALLKKGFQLINGKGIDEVGNALLGEVEATTNIISPQANLGQITVSSSIKSPGVLTAEAFTFLGSGYILTKDVNGNWNMALDNLTVRKSMNVFELTIQEIKSVGGQILLTLANMKSSKILEYPDYWRVYFETDEGAIRNQFEVGDGAICQRFDGRNIKRYWRRVVSKGEDYIDLSKVDCEPGTTGIPEPDDAIIQLGNNSIAARQNAILISSYGVPGLYQYKGISGWSLENKLYTQISPEGNYFKAKSFIIEIDGVETDVKQTLDGHQYTISQHTTEISAIPGLIQTKVAEAVSAIQVGAVNLISNLPGNWVSGRYDTTSGAVVVNNAFIRSVEKYTVKLNFDYTITAQEFIEVVLYDSSDNFVSSFSKDVAVSSLTINTGSASKIGINFRNASTTEITPDFIKQAYVQIEEGNVATAFNYSPSDVQTQILLSKQIAENALSEVTDVESALGDLTNTINTTFKDGVINEAALLAIEERIFTLNNEKNGITAVYNELINNTYLLDKSSLNLDYVTYSNKHADLINAINTAIYDKYVQPNENQLVINAINAYTVALQNLKTRIESSYKAIQDRLKFLFDDGISQTQSQITQTASEIRFEVSQDVTRLDGRIDSSNTLIQANTDSILLKAEKTEVDDLGLRMSSAEQKITPDSITSTVRSHTEYIQDLSNKEGAVFKQSTAPSHLNGRLWIDTSKTPNVWYRSDGSVWKKLTPTEAAEVGAYSKTSGESLETRITQTENNITLTAQQLGGGLDAQGKVVITPTQIYSTVSSKVVEDVNTGINNLQIGGVNLITGDTSLVARTTIGWTYIPLSRQLVEGKTYILGGEFRIDTGTSGVIGLNNADANTGLVILPRNTPFVATAYMASRTHFALAKQVGTSPDLVVSAKEVKLEEGNKKTAWSQSPEYVRAYTDGLFGPLESRVTYAETTIDQNTGQIALRATKDELTTTETNLNTKINNVRVGGENLITDSSSKLPIFNSNSTGTGTRSAVKEEGGDQYYTYTPDAGKTLSIYRGLGLTFIGGQEYVSGIFVRHASVFPIQISLYIDSATPSGYETYTVQPNVWTYLTTGAFIRATSGVGNLIVACTSTGVAVDIKKLKVEEGNKPTTWSLNTNAIEQRVSSAESSLVIQSDQIASKVSNVDYLGGIGGGTLLSGLISTYTLGTGWTRSGEVLSNLTTSLYNHCSSPTFQLVAGKYYLFSAEVDEIVGGGVVSIVNAVSGQNGTTTAAISVKVGVNFRMVLATTSGSYHIRVYGNTSTRYVIKNIRVESVISDRLASAESKITQTANGVEILATQSGGSYNPSTGVVTITSEQIASKVTSTSAFGSEKTSILADASSSANSYALALSRRLANTGEGIMIYKDPIFKNGINNTYLYNNSGGTNVTWTRVARSSDAPNTASAYMMRHSYNGGGVVTPGYGGFSFQTTVKYNTVYLYKIIAKIPTGRSIAWASNALGTGSKVEWLTEVAGNDTFETYIIKVTCGSSGSIATTGFFYFTFGGDTAFNVDVAFATCYDLTNYDYRIENAETAITQNDNKITLAAKRIISQLNGTTDADLTESSIVISPESISLKVKDATNFNTYFVDPVKNYSDGLVSGIRIGGINYWLGSESHVRTATATAWSYASRNLTSFINNGEQMTLQAEIMSGANFNLIAYTCSAASIVWGTTSQTTIFNVTVTPTKQTFKGTFTFSTAQPYVLFYKNTATSVSCNFYRITLGIGNQVSWSLAPEEVKDDTVSTANSYSDGKLVEAKSYTDSGISGLIVGNRNYYAVDLMIKNSVLSGDTRRLQISNLYPSTNYMVCTTVPRPSATVCDVWSASGTTITESSAVNGVAPDAPRMVTTDSSGRMMVSFRQSLHYNNIVNGTYKIWVTQGNKATDFLTAEEDVAKLIDITGNYPIRYIRDYINGSSANAGNHWVQIQAKTASGVNVALNKTVTSLGTNNTTYPNSRIVNGVIDSNDYANPSGTTGEAWMQVDLGSVRYDIAEIIIHHYYADARVYKTPKTIVSSNGTDWWILYDAKLHYGTSGEYVETASGKSHFPTKSVIEAYAKLKLSDTKVKGSLLDTGIDIEAKKIILTAENTVFQNNLGQTVAVFNSNFTKIIANAISLEGLVTVNSKFKVLADGSIEATDGKFTGMVTATSGNVGGFAISSSYMESISGNDRMYLSSGLLKFTGLYSNVMIGADTFPSSGGGAILAPISISVARTIASYSYGNIGLSLSISGATAYDDANYQYTGNNALYISTGAITGVRFRTRRLGTGTHYLSVMDTNIIVVSNTVTIWLPNNPEDGQMYYINPNGYSGVTIRSYTNQNIWDNSGSVGTSSGIGNRVWNFFLYDKVNLRWLKSWMYAG